MHWYTLHIHIYINKNNYTCIQINFYRSILKVFLILFYKNVIISIFYKTAQLILKMLQFGLLRMCLNKMSSLIAKRIKSFISRCLKNVCWIFDLEEPHPVESLSLVSPWNIIVVFLWSFQENKSMNLLK